MSDTTSTLISAGGKLTRQELVLVPTPLGTATHKPSRTPSALKPWWRPWAFAISA